VRTRRHRILALVVEGLLASSCGRPAGSGELPALPSELEAVEPACGDDATATAITLRGEVPAKPVVSTSDPGGSRVETQYRAWLAAVPGAGDVELPDVKWTDAHTLTATVPAGLTPGVYGIVLDSPFGQRARRDAAFEVHRGPCPMPGAALVTATATVAPNAVTVGQQVTVTATVRNMGRAASSRVVASPGSVPDGFALLSSAAGPLDIPGEQSATFTWAYEATTTTPPGGFSFPIDSSGVDPQGAPLTAPRTETNVLFVNLPAILTASSQARPRQVSLGETVTVTLSVANEGSAPAVVVPRLGPVTGSAAMTQTAAPASQTIPGPGVSDFAWDFRADGWGTASFTVTATGTDANSGRPVAVAPTPSVTVTVSGPTLTVSPTSATVAAGGNPIRFRAELTGAPPGTSIDWTLSGLGSISATSGATVDYTPPRTVGVPTQATLTASAYARGLTVTSSAAITVTVR